MKKIAFILLIGLTLLTATLPAMAQQAPATPEGELAPVAAAPQLYNSAIAAFDAQDFERTILDISLYLLVNPTDNRAYLLRAISYAQEDNSEAATDDITQAIGLTEADTDPEFAARLYFLRGSLYGNSNAIDEALADYNQSIAIQPTTDAYISRGLVYITNEDFASALTDFDDAIALDDSDPVLFYYRAAVHAQLGNGQDSAADYVAFFDAANGNLRPANDPLLSGGPEVFPLTAGTIWTIPFEGETGQKVSILAVGRPESGVDPLIVLLSPDGEPLIADDDSASDATDLGSLILDFTLSESGMYTILLTGTLASQDGDALVGIELLDP